jgi:hypothetical protein
MPENPNHGSPVAFSPSLFDSCILHQFSALTKIRELVIDFLDIPSFMPKLQRYFGHFFPTVQSLALRELHRPVSKFGRPQVHLVFQEEPADDLTLVPPFIPPLQGRLTMTCFTRVGILEDMIELFGGIEFRCMDLFYTHSMRLLFGATAKTLETLRLYANDPLCEAVSLDGWTLMPMISQPTHPSRISIYRTMNHFGHSRSRCWASRCGILLPLL